MAVQEVTAESGHRQDGPEHTPRLKLKRKAPVSGSVDGAWWPHSDRLAEELPDLLAVLSVRLGSVERVSYNLDQWPTTQRKMVHAGRTVRIDGYHRQPSDTVGVSDGRGHQIVLLVVPADTEPELAHSVLMAAAATDDTTSVEALLGAND